MGYSPGGCKGWDTTESTLHTLLITNSIVQIFPGKNISVITSLEERVKKFDRRICREKKKTRVRPGLNFGFDAFGTGIPKTMAT